MTVLRKIALFGFKRMNSKKNYECLNQKITIGLKYAGIFVFSVRARNLLTSEKVDGYVVIAR